MSEENTSQELRLKNIDETRNYFIREIDQSKLMNKKDKKVWRVLNYIEPLLIAIFTVCGCISISGFTFLVGILTGIQSSAKGLKIFVITAEIKKYKSIIKKKKVLLAKSTLNSIEILISKAFID